MGILIMKDYLAIIRKWDFVDLFKYGHFRIAYAVIFDGNVEAHADDNDLFNALTYRMNTYEYSFEYLIIHFKALDYNGQDISVDVRNVCGVYTFDLEAKKEMSISFDPRIQLHVSPWASKFEKLHRKLSIKQSMRGIDNLWAIFDLDKSDRTKCEQIINQECIQEVFRELYAYERPVGKLPIWTYLLRYERHSFYPKGMLGFFCDFIHVFCNYSTGKELLGEVAEETKIYPQLIASKNRNLGDLYEIVKASNLSQLTEQAAGCQFIMAAPLFLFLKSKFLEENKLDKNIIDHAKKIGNFECSVAVYLLGIVLGHDKTYDAFYESADLQFFKKKKVVEAPLHVENPNETPSNQPSTTTEVGSDTSDVPEEKVEQVATTAETDSNEPVSEERVETEVATTKVGSDTSDVLEEKVEQVVTAVETDSNTSDVPEENVAPITTSTEDIPKETTQIIDERKVDTAYNLEDLLHEAELSYQGKEIPIQWMRTNSKIKKIDVRPIFNEETFNKFANKGYEVVNKYTSTVNKIIASYGYDPEIEKKRCKNKK